MPHLTAELIVLALAASVQGQQTVWGQCGGEGWKGPTSCVAGSACSTQNAWYAQCLPGAPTTAPAPTTSSTSRTTLTTTTTTSAGPPTNPTGCPAIPGSISGSTSTLPDPFTFAGGSKVTSKASWACRQAELSALLQKYELGTLPPKPSSMSASFSGSSLSITVSSGGKTISFSATIKKPSSGSGPFPAIIGVGGISIPVPSNVATIVFDNDGMAAQRDGSSRGKGKFYDLYGSGHSAGSLMAWAWGVSRVIDALEATPAAGIDVRRIGVTGCSRNGKGAMVAGAFDSRIALTLPQESGAGGSGCWRLEEWQNRNGYNVQDAKQIVGENTWFSPNFNAQVNNVNGLPFDHHSLAGLVAPRPMFVIENPDNEWLGKISTYGCMGAARKQWQALGALDSFGYSQVGGHNHCSFPSAQQGELNAFINKFLVGNANAGTTNVFRTDQTYNGFSIDTWCPWTVPTLS